MGFGAGFGDAKLLSSEQAIKERLRETTGKENPMNDARALYDFAHQMAIGDLVFVKQGRSGLLALGEVSGHYQYDEKLGEYQHSRQVVWVKTGQWEREDTGPVKTLTEITKYDWGKHESLIYGARAPRCWIFQGNPSVYDFHSALSNESLKSFYVGAYVDVIQPGDLGILWLTGDDSGCYALLKVTSLPFKSEGSTDSQWLGEKKEGDFVSVEVVQSFIDNPILKQQCQEVPLLEELNVGFQGSTFQASVGQYELLKQMSGINPDMGQINDEKIWLMHAGTHETGEHGKYWQQYLLESIVAMDGRISDIRDFENKEAIADALEELGEGDRRGARPTQTALAYHQFTHEMSIGDLVLIRSHHWFVGVGRITSDYQFVAEHENAHRRNVEWLSQGQTWAPQGWTWKKLTEVSKYARGSKDVNFGYQGWLELASSHFSRAKTFPVNTWWVNQRESFDKENPQIWTTETMVNGHENKFQKYVRDVREGDLIVHYSRGIQGFSIALQDAERRMNPFEGEAWSKQGFGLDIRFFPLEKAIPLSALQEIDGFVQDLASLIKTDHPFDRHGAVKKGYMFPFSLSMLGHVQNNLDFSFPEPIHGFLKGLEATTIENQENSTVMEPDNIDQRFGKPTNKIFFGPPGTGKTFHIQDTLISKYQSKTNELSREELLDRFVSKLTWAEACAVALLLVKDATVSELIKHELVAAKARVSDSKQPRQTLWSVLQNHVPEECTLVKNSSRQNPIFWKYKEGNTSYFKLWHGMDPEEYAQLEEWGKDLGAIGDENQELVLNHSEFVTFHQSFSYEDFVEGIKPVMADDFDGELRYKIEPGIFKQICEAARRNPKQRYALFIDEINRGNVASIFGELITLIEPDKREGQKNELSVTLPYSKEEFSVPGNLDIYGTMNTADRSVEALDTALRRRFEFEEIKPKPDLFDDVVADGIHIGRLLRTVNERIEHLLDKDHCIGHSYFFSVKDLNTLRAVFSKNILPLLQEYFYGDFGKVGLILGAAFVQKRSERQTSFAAFDHPDADLLHEKEVYDLMDPNEVDAAGYKAIYS